MKRAFPSRESRCVRCNRAGVPGAEACKCSGVVWYRGRRPDWPPLFTYTCEGRSVDHGCDRKLPHQVYGAFILGPVPSDPDLRLVMEPSAGHAREYAHRPRALVKVRA